MERIELLKKLHYTNPGNDGPHSMLRFLLEYLNDLEINAVVNEALRDQRYSLNDE